MNPLPDPQGDLVDPHGDLVDANASRRWRALGTYVHLEVEPVSMTDAAVALAQSVLDEVDSACSRFRPDSDLTRANDAAGRWTPVSPVLVGAVRVALEAAEVTSGLVDPTLGTHLLTAGYDRTFALLATSSNDPAGVPTPPRRDAWRDVQLGADAVRVPEGTRLDLGATGKAYAADLVAATLVELLGVRLVVSVGGDVRVGCPQGHSAGFVAWPVAIAHTLDDLDGSGSQQTVLLHSGGLATSSVAARRWIRGGREWHHLMDPRTGEPTQGPWRTVTALGHSCAAANTASTAAMVLGVDAVPWLTTHGVAARLVDHDDHVTLTPGWPLPAGVPTGIPRVHMEVLR